jgi:hypothetical protein
MKRFSVDEDALDLKATAKPSQGLPPPGRSNQ